MGNLITIINKCCDKLLKSGLKKTEVGILSEPLNIEQIDCRNDNNIRKDSDIINSKFLNNSSLPSSNSYLIYEIKNTFSLQDFRINTVLGRGSFGKVLLVTNIHNRKYYAMKILKKEMLNKQNQVVHTKTEREILEKITHPFVVKLHYAFQTNEKLYLVTDYMPGGDIFYHLRKEGYFSEERTRFYICEIILALEHLHKNKIIYRDLKPENILLDKDGHIRLTDFGLSKIFKRDNFSFEGNSSGSADISRAYTICGTPEYLAPEILIGNGYNKSVDWWSLGAVLYEMLVGHSPFRDNKYKLDINTYLKPIPLNKNISINAYNLIKELLIVDPYRRLGSSERDAEDVKSNIFFKGVNWQNYYDKKIIPKFRPYLKNEEDLSNFDKLFTDEDPNSKSDKFNLFPSYNKRVKDKNYENFTYVNNKQI